MSIGGIIKGALGLGAAAVGTAMLTKAADKVAESSLSSAINAIHVAWNRGAGQNYVTASHPVRVEPYTLVDERAVRLPYIKDVMVAAHKLFSSYYLTSIQADAEIAGVRVSQIMDKYNPDRSLMEATRTFLSTESYQFGLPFVGEAAGLERYSNYCKAEHIPAPASLEANDRGSVGSGKVVQEVQNLAMGSTVAVNLARDGKTATVNVQIKLRTIGMDPALVGEVLSLGAEDNSLKARFRKWRMGELSLVRDLLLDQDRIDAYRRAAMKDRSGYFRKAHSRANRGLFATILTGQPSIGDASSICVTTTETIREVERKSAARFSDFAARQRIFEDSLMMLLFVIDPDHEVLTIYTRDIEEPSIVPISDLKGKQSGGDITDLLKVFLEGRVPGRL